MSVLLPSSLLLGGIGIAGAGILYAVARTFHVAEDPRIAEVEACLPGANCGACGYNGCHDFAKACCNATTLEGMQCPGAGASGMKRIADILGLTATAGKPKIAVLRCNGTCAARHSTAIYDGAPSCRLISSIAGGTTGCTFGCLGEGDCMRSCNFGAITMDSETGLPVIDENKCTGCGICVSNCPKHILELRYKGPRGLRVYVACSSHDKGGTAMKVCKNACIGCGKCMKTCTHDAITVTDNLAYIDFEKCKLCKRCVAVCPTHAIHAENFPVLNNLPSEEK